MNRDERQEARLRACQIVRKDLIKLAAKVGNDVVNTNDSALIWQTGLVTGELLRHMDALVASTERGGAS